MEEVLSNLLQNSSLPLLSAFILGLMTAISPCPLATNVSAIGFIGKDIENRNRVFYNGLIYTAGRAVSYTLLAAVIVLGADQLALSGWFQQYGEKILGPLLIIIGLFMLGVLNLNLPGIGNFAQRYQEKGISSFWEVLLIGVIFALAFCPYSGVLYFGMLMPMTVSSSSGLLLPLIFAIATGIPVIIFAWLIAYTISGVGKLYNGVKIFEKWFRRVVAILFIAIGIYYVIVIYI
ncbi:MAG: aromatic aminobenezylarsenical efflux permease ArsG family transporter [Bacteroidales bacterium]|nr:aromatic aminobenezylarsenical efflux permease ArsG family transporter [Bacteroidales bacterium]